MLSGAKKLIKSSVFKLAKALDEADFSKPS